MISEQGEADIYTMHTLKKLFILITLYPSFNGFDNEFCNINFFC